LIASLNILTATLTLAFALPLSHVAFETTPKAPEPIIDSGSRLDQGMRSKVIASSSVLVLSLLSLLVLDEDFAVCASAISLIT